MFSALFSFITSSHFIWLFIFLYIINRTFKKFCKCAAATLLLKSEIKIKRGFVLGWWKYLIERMLSLRNLTNKSEAVFIDHLSGIETNKRGRSKMQWIKIYFLPSNSGLQMWMVANCITKKFIKYFSSQFFRFIIDLTIWLCLL